MCSRPLEGCRENTTVCMPSEPEQHACDLAGDLGSNHFCALIEGAEHSVQIKIRPSAKCQVSKMKLQQKGTKAVLVYW